MTECSIILMFVLESQMKLKLALFLFTPWTINRQKNPTKTCQHESWSASQSFGSKLDVCSDCLPACLPASIPKSFQGCLLFCSNLFRYFRRGRIDGGRCSCTAPRDRIHIRGSSGHLTKCGNWILISFQLWFFICFLHLFLMVIPAKSRWQNIDYAFSSSCLWL